MTIGWINVHKMTIGGINVHKMTIGGINVHKMQVNTYQTRFSLQREGVE